GGGAERGEEVGCGGVVGGERVDDVRVGRRDRKRRPTHAVLAIEAEEGGGDLRALAHIEGGCRESTARRDQPVGRGDVGAQRQVEAASGQRGGRGGGGQDDRPRRPAVRP